MAGGKKSHNRKRPYLCWRYALYCIFTHEQDALLWVWSESYQGIYSMGPLKSSNKYDQTYSRKEQILGSPNLEQYLSMDYCLPWWSSTFQVIYSVPVKRWSALMIGANSGCRFAVTAETPTLPGIKISNNSSIYIRRPAYIHTRKT